MIRRNQILASAAAVVAVGLAAAAAVFFLLIKSDPPAAVSIGAAVGSLPTADARPATPASSTTTPQTPAAPQATAAVGTAGGGLSGDWRLASGGTSFLGYRVQEQLVGIGANTAVGRTSAIQATLAFDGAAITRLQVTADLTQLRSDNNLRDGQLRTQAIETNRFPSATFSLTSPIQIGSVPAEGQTITRTIEGELTIHGVTRRISMEVQGQLWGGQLVVVGSTTIIFADYNIGQPRGASVVSIENRGVMELQLVFAKAGG